MPTCLFGYIVHSQILLSSTPKYLAAASFDVFSAYSTALSFNNTLYALLFDIPIILTPRGERVWLGKDPAIIRDPACIAYLIYTAPASKQDPALIWTRLINGHIRYIDFLILLIPTPLVSVLQQHPYFLFILKTVFIVCDCVFPDT